LPKALSIITLFFPVLAPALVPLVTRYFQARQNGVNLPAVLAYLVSVVPVILLALSSMFGFRTSLFRCGLEGRWQHLFQIKDDQAIRAIQDTLRCCGLNSVRDRAWPFPSNTVDAGTCERTQGWNVRCLDPWERQESTAAGMVGLANLSSWALVVRLHTTPWRDCVLIIADSPSVHHSHTTAEAAATKLWHPRRQSSYQTTCRTWRW
jgi:hypothetical protein